MRIGIDVRMVTPFMHGISRYAYNLIKGLSAIDTKNDYVLFSNDTFLKDFVSSRDNFSLKVVNLRLYRMREQISFPKLLKKEKIDIFHSPSFFGPVFGSCKVIMSIHDVIHLLFPKQYSILHKIYFRCIVRRASMTARRIITASENSKHDISNILRIPSEKIAVTYYAPDENFRRSNEDKIKKIRDNLCINDRFILYVGNQKPHKNLCLLIEAYHQLKRKIRLQLIIVGQKNPLFQKKLCNNIENGVRFVGEVSDELLPDLYSAADVYVSPSLYEGFGFSPLEAMACGTAVVAVKTPSVNEILGNAGYIAEGNRPEELDKAIYKILLNKNMRNSLIKKGLERVKLFSWKETASKTLKIYEDVFKE